MKIICIGLNYRDHAAETGMALPDHPIVFAKFENTVIADGEAIVIPSITSFVDYEAELAVIMGRRASAVSVDEALDHVEGYTCANDVSARDHQFADTQWTFSKTFDTFFPMGPRVVPAAEIGDPQDLAISCTVNGTKLQDSSTSQMIFGVAELISFVSQGVTLEPGDVISTGTPAGVGMARNPNIKLAPGDSVTVEIEKIGALTNPVVARGA